MRHHPLARSTLLLVLVGLAARAREPEDTIKIRTLKVSEHPSRTAEALYVAGKVVTALHFEREVDPRKTSLLAWEGRFEPPLVGGRMVVLAPLRDLGADETVPLHVTLVDGTEFAFLVKRPYRESWGGIDHQVNVFRDPESFDAVLSSLYSSLKRERELNDENERLKKEENSVDHAFATLLARGQISQTPFKRMRSLRPKDQDMEMTVELLSGPGKAAALIFLKNTYYGGDWTLDEAYLTRDLTSSKELPFALRMDRSVIVPGQSGTIAVVVDKSAFKTKEGQLTDLVLQIYRGDGLLQVAVKMERSLIQQ